VQNGVKNIIERRKYMTRTQIRLDTLTDVNRFVATMSKIDEPVYLEDGAGIKVSAKSALGVLYSMEFTHIYCYCEKDISGYLIPWAI
jgi:hypothetical protein